VKSENVEDESIPESNIKEEVIPPSPAQIQEMLKKTQQMIEERKK